MLCLSNTCLMLPPSVGMREAPLENKEKKYLSHYFTLLGAYHSVFSSYFSRVFAISSCWQVCLDETVPTGRLGAQRRRRRKRGSGQGQSTSTMSASWNDDDEDFKIGVRVDLKTRPRFSFTELKMLLDAVKRNRYIILSE